MKLPAHLANHVASGVFVPGQPIAQFMIGPMRNFIYVILDWNSRRAAIVDTHKGMDPVFLELKKHGFKLESLILTHSHHDHVSGIAEIAAYGPNIPLYVHPLEEHRLTAPEHQLLGHRSLADGQKVQVGSLTLTVIHTPGHTGGECCLHLAPYLLTGDMLFIRDCGRTDFPGSSNDDMFTSLQRIKTLSPDTIILPGHHYQLETASILADELKTSPPLLCKSAAELQALP